jgi:NADH-quinone oxidoreductase subunit C
MQRNNLVIYLIESYKKKFLDIDNLIFSSAVFITNDNSCNLLEIKISNSNIVELVEFLESDPLLSFKQLLDIFSVDYPERQNRFQLNYIFLSTELGIRLRLVLDIPLNQYVTSISSVFKSAGWLEREVWDMHGIVFLGHKDLRRILTNYGFSSFPLRKDFPLSGFTEIRYDDELKTIVEEPILLQQEFRYFDFLSPWNLTDNNLNFKA